MFGDPAWDCADDGEPRSTADVFADAIAKAPPAFGSVGYLQGPPHVNAWDEAWDTVALPPTGSVDTSKAGGR